MFEDDFAHVDISDPELSIKEHTDSLNKFHEEVNRKLACTALSQTIGSLNDTKHLLRKLSSSLYSFIQRCAAGYGCLR